MSYSDLTNIIHLSLQAEPIKNIINPKNIKYIYDCIIIPVAYYKLIVALSKIICFGISELIFV